MSTKQAQACDGPKCEKSFSQHKKPEGWFTIRRYCGPPASYDIHTRQFGQNVYWPLPERLDFCGAECLTQYLEDEAKLRQVKA